MVWLAKWIREHVTGARVLIVTDRTELDEQIEGVFKGVSEDIHRTRNGADFLVQSLNTSEEWLIGSLIHKFGASEEVSDRDSEAYVEEIRKNLPKGFRAKGEIFVFRGRMPPHAMWFETKTQGLTDVAKAQLKQRWGTLRRVLSSRNRLEKIVADILFDVATRDRLKSGYGNAMLVSDSIYSACRFFEMFQQTDLADRCAIVTSYRPSPADIKGEETGEGLTEKLRQYGIYRQMLAAHFNEPEETAMYKVVQFEKEAKKRFIEQPGQMKLLIVVDKLLTGFDAPSATYLYIDKPMQDHGLFQAICRVNRLDGEDKEYGYVIDYKDLFRSLEQSVKDYTGEAFDGYDKADVEGLLKDRLTQGQERLEEAREAVKALCEPVEPPRDTAASLRA